MNKNEACSCPEGVYISPTCAVHGSLVVIMAVCRNCGLVYQGKCMKCSSRCQHCGGSGILNTETIETYMLGNPDPLLTWESKASWCHACPEGELWKEVLGDG